MVGELIDKFVIPVVIMDFSYVDILHRHIDCECRQMMLVQFLMGEQQQQTQIPLTVHQKI